MKPWIAGARSALFYVGYSTLTAVIATLVVLSAALLPLEQRAKLARLWCRAVLGWLRITCGVRCELQGIERLPEAPFVVLSKHQSPWDTFFLQLPFGTVSTVLKRELLWIPFFGWALRALQPIAIDRGDARQAARQVTQIGKERLSNGRSVLIFPEGTRIEPGSQGTYSRGGASLACAANVPVVPVAHNAGLCWPAHRFTKYPGTIRVEVGPPIDCSGRTAREVNAEAEAWIESRSLAMLPPGMATPGAAETP
ncbi:MAG: lysophospholipid acyltransferase family protein [Pseudomonadota bacterium]|nr:lysophospholipid acyltransferase family protein [Pseudomonadota bacterium]